jgi:hypothetical protein
VRCGKNGLGDDGRTTSLHIVDMYWWDRGLVRLVRQESCSGRKVGIDTISRAIDNECNKQPYCTVNGA